jgi:hypothetical protein
VVNRRFSAMDEQLGSNPLARKDAVRKRRPPITVVTRR